MRVQLVTSNLTKMGLTLHCHEKTNNKMSNGER